MDKKWVQVQAYKHDGSLHRMWSYSYLIHEDENFYVLVSVRSKVEESSGRIWHTKEPALFILSKNKWFNVIAMMKENNNGITYYVNIASPTIYDQGFLKYIDYDLDVKLYPDGGTKLLDLKEYKRHTVELHYEKEITDKLTTELHYVYDLIEKKEFPFIDEEIYRYYNIFLEKTKFSKE